MKIGPNSMQNSRKPQDMKFLSCYNPSDHAGTAEKGMNRI